MYLGRTALDTALYQQETAFNRRTEVSQLSGKLHTILVTLSIYKIHFLYIFSYKSQQKHLKLETTAAS